MIVCLQEVTLWDEVTALPIPPNQSSHRAGNGDAIGMETRRKNEGIRSYELGVCGLDSNS